MRPGPEPPRPPSRSVLRSAPLRVAAVLAALWAGSGPGAGTPGAPPVAVAQEPGDAAGGERLSEEARSEVFEFLNAPTTLVVPGSTAIPEGTRLGGDVAILGGSLSLAGRVEGHLVVVNGDLSFQPGARVEGDVRVVGGRVEARDAGTVDGTVGAYPEPLRYERRDGRIVEATEDVRLGRDFQVELGRATARVSARAGTNYNRVEGLPVLVGPLLDTGGRNPLQVEAFAVWRSVHGLDISRETTGYDVRARQWLGGRQTWAVGGSFFSEVVPVERWGVSDVEASLATFLLRRDFRDYYEREGWSAHLEYTPSESPVELRLEYRDERHHFAPVRNAWALRDEEDRPWRPQPMVGEGGFRSAGLEVGLDTRNDPTHPSDGWLLEGTLRAGVGGSLALPDHHPLDEEGNEAALVEGATVDHGVSFGLLDLRRYVRLSPASTLAVRGILSGSLAGGPLPPQFQTALGGVGSVPGRATLSGDCGARERSAVLPGDDPARERPVQSAYGCDRLGLLQAEYRGRFPVSWSPLPDSWEDEAWAGALDLQPRWAFFANVARGWSLGDGASPGPRRDTGTMADVGAGLFLGVVGVYASIPVTGDQRRPNLFLRLERRF